MILLVSGGTKTFRPILEERTDVFGTLATPLDGNSLPSIGQWAADNSAYNGPTACPRCSVGRIYVCGTHSAKREQRFVAMLPTSLPTTNARWSASRRWPRAKRLYTYVKIERLT